MSVSVPYELLHTILKKPFFIAQCEHTIKRCTVWIFVSFLYGIDLSKPERASILCQLCGVQLINIFLAVEPMAFILCFIHLKLSFAIEMQ